MNATDKFLAASAQVDEAATPLPNSWADLHQRPAPDIRVPMREISQADTPTGSGANTRGEKNPRIFCSTTAPAPYTDPAAARIDPPGLPALRQRWIEERGDTEVLPTWSSEFGQLRAADPKPDELRFPGLHRKPRRAAAGANRLPRCTTHARASSPRDGVPQSRCAKRQPRRLPRACAPPDPWAKKWPPWLSAASTRLWDFGAAILCRDHSRVRPFRGGPRPRHHPRPTRNHPSPSR